MTYSCCLGVCVVLCYRGLLHLPLVYHDMLDSLARGLGSQARWTYSGNHGGFMVFGSRDLSCMHVSNPMLQNWKCAAPALVVTVLKVIGTYASGNGMRVVLGNRSLMHECQSHLIQVGR